MRISTLLFCIPVSILTLGGAGIQAADDTPPEVNTVLPGTNTTVVTLSEIEVFFSEDVQGVNASDLLINGMAATNVIEVVPTRQYLFSFSEPANTGTVQIAWVGSHGITDLADPPNSFGGGSWTYTLHPGLALYSVRINEFLASNSGDQANSIRDEDGTASDWIELYNGSPISVNLDGTYLTDTKGNLRKWRMPAYSLLPNTYLIVWASNKDRTNVLSPLHTNFRLSTEPGFLALIDPNGTNAISFFDPYPNQRSDASYGRDPLDPSSLGYYTVTTPGAGNSTAGSAADFTPDVIFSRQSGTFVDDFDLVLSNPSVNAVIRYVLVTNGTTAAASLTNVPTASSLAYTGPIPINKTTQVRARAFETGKLPGTPVSHTYFQLSPNVVGFSSDLPIVIVHNFGASATLPTTDQTMALASFEAGLERSSLTNKPNLVTRGAANDRGSSTGGQVKQNMAIEFWDEFNQDTDKPLLGMPPESDWVFYAINGFDPGLMHNAIFHWFGHQLGRYNSRTRYVEVFRKTALGPITTNDYFGLYLLEEKPKRNDNRVNIPALRAADTNGLDVTGGYLLRIDRTDADEHFFSPPQINSLRPTPASIVIDSPARSGTPAVLVQSNYIRGYLLNFLTNLSVTNISQETGYPAYIETDSWIDNLVVNILCYNVDGYRLSGYFFKDRGRKLEQGPLWDCDRCLGTGGSGGAVPQTDARPFNPRQWRVPTTSQTADNGTDFFGRSTVGVSWFEKLFSDPDFWQKWIDRYQSLRTNEYSTATVFGMIDGFHEEIQEAQLREQGRWSGNFSYPRAGVNSANGYSFNFGPTNTVFARGGYFSNEVRFQKQWFLDRFEFMDTNFLAMPVLASGSGMVTNGTMVTVQPATKANTLLLYTVDGTDPRLPGGGISPSARTNVGPLVLTISNNVRVVARSYNTSHANLTNAGSSLYGNPILNSFWSGPVAATYYLTIPPLRITEIMYHPANPPPGVATNDDNFEYVEVKNIGATPLNVNRFRLRGGVDFDLPNEILGAGESAVIVRDLATFRSRYGATPRVLGVYTNDNLSNDSDRLILEGSVREPILDFSYDDQWYPITDGAGFSLQIIDDTAAPATWSHSASWRPSGVLQGTPGVDDPGSLDIAAVYLNEALTHTDPLPGDAIELWNSSEDPVNIGGWFLTDDFGTPKKYRIPNDTTIPGNGYLVFYQSNSFGVGPNNFALSSKGDEVYLFSADAGGNLSGWVSGYEFGAQANGPTFGRHVISTGREDFVTQISATLGSANSGAKVGPMVISEINYHPPDLQGLRASFNNEMDEYIELHNLSSSPVPLYDPLNPANTWRLQNAVDFIFPPGVVVPPGAHILVVSFDPADPVALAAFNNAHGVPAGTAIYGPWSGQLDNSLGTIELLQPDLPDPPGTPSEGFVPYLLADKVAYEDVAPWPVGLPDGLGAVLGRIDVSAYGNDPANWRTSPKTPGAPLPAGGVAPVIVTQPSNTAGIEGQSASFTIAATGSGLGYIWTFNGTVLNGASSPTLTINNLRLNQAGNYACFVFNSAGSVQSSTATLTVRMLPRITQHPVGRAVYIKPDSKAANLPDGTNVVFTVEATTVEPPLGYQWRFNGIDIAGATSSSLTVTNVQLEDEGDYSCAVTDGVATVESLRATLVPWLSPRILQVSPPPTNAVPPLLYTNYVPVGSPITFSAAIIGNPPPFTYVWRLGSSPLGTPPVSDSRTNVYTFNAQAVPVTGTYRLIVTNVAQPTATAGPWFAEFKIVTLADDDQDGIPDNYEVLNGLDTNNVADALGDLDSDGMSNLDEYRVGTDPNNSLSHLRVELSAVGGATIQVAAVANRNYTVQYSDGLGSLQWTKLADIFAQGTDRVESIVDPGGSSNRFYRVVFPQQP